MVFELTTKHNNEIFEQNIVADTIADHNGSLYLHSETQIVAIVPMDSLISCIAKDVIEVEELQGWPITLGQADD